MSYATPDDLLNFLGARELSQIAPPDDMDPITPKLMRLTIEGGDRSVFNEDELKIADAALNRIQNALIQAGYYIDTYLGGSFSDPVLPQICQAIARFTLHNNDESKPVKERYDQALSMLKDLRETKKAAAALESVVVVSAGMPSYVAVPSIFNQSTLKDF